MLLCKEYFDTLSNLFIEIIFYKNYSHIVAGLVAADEFVYATAWHNPMSHIMPTLYVHLITKI